MENKNRQASINSHLTPQTDSGQLNWSTATTTNADMILSSDIIIIVRWWSCLFRDFPALYGCVCVGGVLRNDMTDKWVLCGSESIVIWSDEQETARHTHTAWIKSLCQNWHARETRRSLFSFFVACHRATFTCRTARTLTSILVAHVRIQI